jgi:hypothetical protein
MPPPTPPTAAPPNFYDSLPGGQGAGAGPAKGGKQGEDDTDGEVLKALTGCYRVLGKVAKLKGDLKGGIAKIKDDIKALVVQGLKKDPSELESGDGGEDAGAAAPEPAPAPPKSTDETHAA